LWGVWEFPFWFSSSFRTYLFPNGPSLSENPGTFNFWSFDSFSLFNPGFLPFLSSFPHYLACSQKPGWFFTHGFPPGGAPFGTYLGPFSAGFFPRGSFSTRVSIFWDFWWCGGFWHRVFLFSATPLRVLWVPPVFLTIFPGVSVQLCCLCPRSLFY